MRNTILVLNEEQQFQLDLVIEHYVAQFGSIVNNVCIADSMMPADVNEMITLTQIVQQLREGGDDGIEKYPIKL